MKFSKIIASVILGLVFSNASFGITVSFNPEDTGKIINQRNLAGTCLPIWNSKDIYQEIKKGLSMSNYRLFRFPNGSLSNGYHWNSSGSYNADSVWVSDSAAFKPGFLSMTKNRGTSVNSYGFIGTSKITDGDTNTFWRSDDFVAGSAPYFYLQMPGSTVVDSIVILWGDKYAVDFSVDYFISAAPYPGPFKYPDNFWSNQKLVTGNDQTVFAAALPSMGVNYVRVLIKKFKDQEKSVEVKEVYLYAKGKQVSVNTNQYKGSGAGDQTRVVAMPTHCGNTIRPDYSTGWVNWDFETFMNYTKSISDSSVPIMCVNYGTGTPQEAAAWVYYANKVKNYNIRYWQIGNEMDGEWEEGGPVNAFIYAEKYLQYVKAMKAVDSTIKILGPVLSNADFNVKNSGVFDQKSWTQTFIDTIGALEKAEGKKYCDGIDFHSYPYWAGSPTAAGMMQKIDYVYDQTDLLKTWIAKSLLNPDSVYVMMSEFNSSVVLSSLLQKTSNGIFVANMYAGLAQKFGSRAMSVFWDSFEDVNSGSDGTFGSLSLFNVVPNTQLSSLGKAPSVAYWALFAVQNLWIDPNKQNTIDTANFKRSDNVRAYGIKTDTDFRALMFNVSFSPETLSCTLSVNSYSKADVYTWGEAEFQWIGKDRSAAAFPNCGPVSYTTATADLKTIVVPAQGLCIIRYHNLDSAAAQLKLSHVSIQDPNKNPKRVLISCGSVFGGINTVYGIDYAFDGDTTFAKAKSLDSAYDGPFESFYDSISTAGLDLGPHVIHFLARIGESTFALDSFSFSLNIALGSKNAPTNRAYAMSEKRAMNRIELRFATSLADAKQIRAQVYSLNGRCIKTLECVSDAEQNMIRWQGEDGAGNKVSEGVYLLVVKSDKELLYKKAITINR